MCNPAGHSGRSLPGGLAVSAGTLSLQQLPVCLLFLPSEYKTETQVPLSVLFIIAIATLIVRYRGSYGQLVPVLRRDGGLLYIALAGPCLLTSVTLTVLKSMA